jgi:hypothetical protein
MECLDCGKSFDKDDLLAMTCKGCGEPLMPEDAKNLEANLGIVKEVPDIEVPVLVPDGGIKLPDVMDSPCCGIPLMGQELIDFNSGKQCPYCNAPNPNAGNSTTLPPAAESAKVPKLSVQGAAAEPTSTEPMSQENTATPTQSDKSILVRMCTGPLANVSDYPAGNIFDLPVNKILGREFFNQQIATLADGDEQVKTWYKKSIERLSREHFMIMEDLTVKDMGSTNCTYLDRDEVIDQGGKFTSGKFLILADEIALSRVHSSADDGPSLRVTHCDTGITVDVPEGQQFHLGRLREDGRREPLTFVVSDTLKRTDGFDHDELRRISRRHATIYIEEFEDPEATRGKMASMVKGLTIENIDGKQVLIEESNVNNDYSLTANQRTYKLNAENSKHSIHHKGAHLLTIGKQNFLIEFID